MKTVNLVALILLVVGGLNWLLVGLFEWDLVGGLFGGMDSALAKLVYILVGLAAIYSISLLPKLSRN
ncbi:membrane protein [Mesobacillus campisalis]|uniref:Membrane protein n=1 Tax=Mesobacillus campisalis TaxID=1408103 RepID=A0A0M2SU18_9BACI|nr:DUF378 domain-containing protein [Mesobacillus campisalis]KKK38069.1 membrane protein [Mesobacillus campisalis]